MLQTGLDVRWGYGIFFPKSNDPWITIHMHTFLKRMLGLERLSETKSSDISDPGFKLR